MKSTNSDNFAAGAITYLAGAGWPAAVALSYTSARFTYSTCFEPLASSFGAVGIIGCAIALFEISAVLVLRAHYTMDVFCGILAALYVHRLAIDISPTVDSWIAQAIRLVLH